MWLVFGLGAIAFALLNIANTMKNKNADVYRFSSLSLTAFPVCSFYATETSRVLKGDWGGLIDVMPAVSKAL